MESPVCSLEGLMLKLKLQYSGPPNANGWLIWKRPWCWKRLRAGGEGDNRGWDGWIESSTQWPWVWVDSGGWWWTGRPGVMRFMGSQRVGHDWATELTNWTELSIRSDSLQTNLSCYERENIEQYSVERSLPYMNRT